MTSHVGPRTIFEDDVPHNKLQQHAAERPEVRLIGRIGPPVEHVRCVERRRAYDPRGTALRVKLVGHHRDAKVNNHRLVRVHIGPVARDQDVLWFEVAVVHLLPVHVVHCVGYRPEDLDNVDLGHACTDGTD